MTSSAIDQDVVDLDDLDEDAGILELLAQRLCLVHRGGQAPLADLVGSGLPRGVLLGRRRLGVAAAGRRGRGGHERVGQAEEGFDRLSPELEAADAELHALVDDLVHRRAPAAEVVGDVHADHHPADFRVRLRLAQSAPERSSVAAGSAVRPAFRVRVWCTCGEVSTTPNRSASAAPYPRALRRDLARARPRFAEARAGRRATRRRPARRFLSEVARVRELGVNICPCSLFSRLWRPSSRRTGRLDRATVACMGDRGSARRHHRHRHLARAGVHQGVSRPPRVENQGRRRLQGREPRLSGQRQPRSRGSPRRFRPSTASSSSTASTRSSRRSTSSCSRAWTDGRTWRR